MSTKEKIVAALTVLLLADIVYLNVELHETDKRARYADTRAMNAEMRAHEARVHALNEISNQVQVLHAQQSSARLSQVHKGELRALAMRVAALEKQ